MNFLKSTPEERKVRLWYAAMALVMAIVYDVFFWKNLLGLNFLLFILVYVAGFLLLVTITNQLRQKMALLLLIPIFLLGFTTLLYSNEFVQNWVPLIVAVFLFFFSILVTVQNPAKHLLVLRHLNIFRSIEVPFFKWGLFFKDIFVWKTDDKKQVHQKVLLGILIAIPLLLIFGSLLAKADAIFAETLKRFFDIDVELVWRIIRTIILTLLITAFFYTLVGEEHILTYKEIKAYKIDPIILTVIFCLVNVLFLLFVAIQFRYLFGTSTFVLENGMTFAEYARSGFFELVWVMVLSGILLIISYRSSSHHGASAFLKVLKTLLIAEVAVMAISALKRMNLYQAEFGYTILRLYVEWFIYFTIVIFGITALSMLFNWKFRYFFFSSVLLGAAALVVISFVNVDYLIAKVNVDRHLVGKKELDITYLSKLSIDTLPAFEQFMTLDQLAKMPYSERDAFLDLYGKYMQIRKDDISWLEWHMGRKKIYDTIDLGFPPEQKTQLDTTAEDKRVYKTVLQDLTTRHAYYGSSCPSFAGYENVCYRFQDSEPTVFYVLDTAVSSSVRLSVYNITTKEFEYIFLSREDNTDREFRFLSDGSIIESIPTEWQHISYKVTQNSNTYSISPGQKVLFLPEKL